MCTTTYWLYVTKIDSVYFGTQIAPKCKQHVFKQHSTATLIKMQQQLL